MTRQRVLVTVFSVLIGAFALIQLVPFGHQHTNPPAGTSVVWDSPRTLELARRACFDCHSNETKWPWYSSIAPISWKVQGHVDEGREKLNFTAFDAASRKMTKAAGKASEEVREGGMPLSDYLLLHPLAHLTAAEKQELIRGLEATFSAYARHGAAPADSAAVGEGGEGDGKDDDGDRD
jgi:hypothetical protein